MQLKLTSDDRNAIDLLLGEAAAAAKSPAQRYVSSSGTQNVQAVERVLQLLQVLPVSEPPKDLASRTMARIAQATGQIFDMPAATTGTNQGQQIRPA